MRDTDRRGDVRHAGRSPGHAALPHRVHAAIVGAVGGRPRDSASQRRLLTTRSVVAPVEGATLGDPVYLAAPYESYDVMHLSDVPFQKQPCKDMTPEFQQ